MTLSFSDVISEARSFSRFGLLFGMVVLILSATGGTLLADPPIISIDPDIELLPLGDSLYIHRSWMSSEKWGRFPCNGMVLVRNGKALLVDTPMTVAQTKTLCDYFRQTFNAEIVCFIAGHYHDDNIGGLAHLESLGTRTIANELTIAKCRELGLPTPREAFQKELTLDFEGETIECYFPGGGHTFDNIAVNFPGHNVLFGGCLIRSLASANLGNLADAVPDQWPGSVDNLTVRFPQSAVVVPGHGDYGGRDLLTHTKALAEAYLSQKQ